MSIIDLYTVRNGILKLYLLEAVEDFKSIPSYKVTNIAQIKMNYIPEYIQKRKIARNNNEMTLRNNLNIGASN